MLKNDYCYCQKFNSLKWLIFYFYIIIGRIKKHDIPSYHPYWKLLIKKNKLQKIKKMYRSNFVAEAIANGFKPNQEKFNPHDNWFGVSVYHPDLKLIKGNKMIQLSLHGIGMNLPTDDDMYEKVMFSEVAKKSGLKYIGFFYKNKPVYEDWFGNIPNEQFINKFIKTNILTKIILKIQKTKYKFA